MMKFRLATLFLTCLIPGLQAQEVRPVPDPAKTAWWPLLDLDVGPMRDPTVAWIHRQIRSLGQAARADGLDLPAWARIAQAPEIWAAAPLRLRAAHPPREQEMEAVLLHFDHSRALPWGPLLQRWSKSPCKPIQGLAQAWEVAGLRAHLRSRPQGAARLLVSNLGVRTGPAPGDPLLTGSYELRGRRRILRPAARRAMRAAPLTLRVDGTAFLDPLARTAIRGFYGPTTAHWGLACMQVEGRRCFDLYSGIRTNLGLLATTFKGIPEDVPWQGRLTRRPAGVCALGLGEGWVRSVQQQAQMILGLLRDVGGVGPDAKVIQHSLALLDSLSGNLWIAAYCDPIQPKARPTTQSEQVLRSLRGTLALEIRDGDAAASRRRLDRLLRSLQASGDATIRALQHQGQVVYRCGDSQRLHIHLRSQGSLLVAGLGRSSAEALELAAEATAEPSTAGLPIEFRRLKGAVKLHLQPTLMPLVRHEVLAQLQDAFPGGAACRAWLRRLCERELLGNKLSAELRIGKQIGGRLRLLF